MKTAASILALVSFVAFGFAGTAHAGEGAARKGQVNVQAASTKAVLAGPAVVKVYSLISGAKEGPFQPPADNYRLDLSSGGAITLILDGKSRPLRSQAPTSYQISSRGVQPTSFKGPDCP